VASNGRSSGLFDAFTWQAIVAGIVVFMALHWGALHWVDPDFGNAFRLSRGVAAAALTLLGVVALVDATPQLRVAFVYRHDDDDWMRVAMLFVCGHFVSDIAWMALGHLRRGAPVRWDLVAHHLLGVAAYSIALALRTGYALALVVMVTEVMPMTSGMKGLGQKLGAQRLVAFADAAHLQILIWFRLPLWTVLLVLTLRVLLAGRTGDLLTAYVVVGAGLALLVALDVFWICRSLRSQRRIRGEAAAGSARRT
jgi:hypothetical protein